MEIKELGMEYPIRLFNGARNQVYYGTEDGFWWKQRYDEQQRVVYFENSYGRKEGTKYTDNGKELHIIFQDGSWEDWHYDSDNRVVYRYNALKHYWFRKEFDSEGNLIYLENSIDGIIIPKKVERTVVVNGKEYSESTVQRALEHYITS